MQQVEQGTLLWRPSKKDISQANLTDYLNWLAVNLDLHFEGYEELWSWSVEDLESFWRSIWDYFEVIASQEPDLILARRIMQGARWFEGAELNYAENFFARSYENKPALVYKSEDAPQVDVYWSEIKSKTAALAAALKEAGVRRGDRVVAFMPNIPETVICLFATASIGAIWSSCSPDFGSRSVLDRFQQIEPKVLIAVDGYRYGGKAFDRKNTVRELQEGLPSLKMTIIVQQVDAGEETGAALDGVIWNDLLERYKGTNGLDFEQVPFNHPLWVLYSSGTTGLPKPIVQGHGGILLEHLKMASLHLDLKPDDRFFWYTSTGWMMWNFLVAGLLTRSTLVVYNGSPGYPDIEALWRLAAESGMTYFGTSAAFIGACMKAGLSPNASLDLRRIRAVGSTGSPLTADGFGWVYDNINRHLALESVSGGTDLCTAFVGGSRLLPIYAGEIQCAVLGANVKAYNEAGEPVIGQVGELVITEPMPSMPLFFWNDPGGERYQESYFDMYPSVWRHGDWIEVTEHGGFVIYGRSDSTINRQGVRMGTSEIYGAVESLPEVIDSLVVDLEILGGESYMPMFVVLNQDLNLDEDLHQRILQIIRQEVSPRHVPDDVFQIDEVPYTLSGKKMEIPVRKILLGQSPEKAANPGAMRNPQSIRYFITMARELEAARTSTQG